MSSASMRLGGMLSRFHVNNHEKLERIDPVPEIGEGRPVVFGLLDSGEWSHRYYENDWVDWTPF